MASEDFREKAARFYTGDCQFAICGYNRRAIMPSVPPKLIIEPGRAGRSYWRDLFRYVVPFIVQFGLYISPVGFSSAMVPAKWRLLYDFNPMAGVIEGSRWPISNGRSLFPRQGLLLARYHRSPARHQHLLLPQNGTNLCRCDLKLGTIAIMSRQRASKGPESRHEANRNQ